jgi:hypothetical protein
MCGNRFGPDGTDCRSVSAQRPALLTDVARLEWPNFGHSAVLWRSIRARMANASQS